MNLPVSVVLWGEIVKFLEIMSPACCTTVTCLILQCKTYYLYLHNVYSLEKITYWTGVKAVDIGIVML